MQEPMEQTLARALENPKDDFSEFYEYVRELDKKAGDSCMKEFTYPERVYLRALIADALGDVTCLRGGFAATMAWHSSGEFKFDPVQTNIHPWYCIQGDDCVRGIMGSQHYSGYDNCPATHAAEMLDARNHQYYGQIWVEGGCVHKQGGWEDLQLGWCGGSYITYPCMRCLSYMHGHGVRSLMWVSPNRITFHSVEAHLAARLLQEVRNNAHPS